MKTIEFFKNKGEISDMAALHDWLDKQVKWIRNGSHTLQIVEKPRKRSLSQNRLMWLWFACIEQETGQPSQDVHDYYCLKLLKREVVDPSTGETIIVGGHTSLLSVEQFTDFLNKVQSDAATELGITLPSPDDMSWEEFEQTYKDYVR